MNIDSRTGLAIIEVNYKLPISPYMISCLIDGHKHTFHIIEKNNLYYIHPEGRESEYSFLPFPDPHTAARLIQKYCKRRHGAMCNTVDLLV